MYLIVAVFSLVPCCHWPVVVVVQVIALRWPMYTTHYKFVTHHNQNLTVDKKIKYIKLIHSQLKDQQLSSL